ncbi:hypothetical protein E2562_017532 [Oryza meyeriana var. granulata]|uniref:Uncharacterized protein n=1 Tax=Oryza meyeriana var. granulata TaxID=110450 RepID=A0A6G1C6W7_9ORYZ|nr:hypothetical protein E2562_017532 [Oryza meyeriana var. granulata]
MLPPLPVAESKPSPVLQANAAAWLLQAASVVKGPIRRHHQLREVLQQLVSTTPSSNCSVPIFFVPFNNV